MLAEADNAVFVFSSPLWLIEMFGAFILRNIFICDYLSPSQPSLSHERQSAGEEPSPHPCAIHQMFTFFFFFFFLMSENC